ncbi:MAG: PH domain-containing protein [Acidimicrobiia bacterium]
MSLGAAVAINANGRPSVGGGLVGAVCLLVALLALSSLRFKVRAEPRHLVVCSGGPTRKIPWADVQGFGIDEKRGRNVYVVVPGDRKMLLPIPEVRTGKITPTEVRDQLQRYWKTHRHGR